MSFNIRDVFHSQDLMEVLVELHKLKNLADPKVFEFLNQCLGRWPEKSVRIVLSLL